MSSVCQRRHLFSALVFAALLALTGIAPLAAEPAQPTNLQVLHRSGQTFVTWTERGELAGEHYRIYRHSQPITSANLGQAVRLYEVAEGSGRFYSNRYPAENDQWRHRWVERYVIEDKGLPIPDGTGLLAWTLAAADFGGSASGNGYYAVTTVNASGAENVADFASSNTAGPLAELVADPRAVEISPTLISIGPGGHVFIQYMDLRNWNPTFHAPNFTNYYYGLDPADPAIAGAVQYAYDYWIYEPDAYCGGSVPAQTPLTMSLHGWDGNNYPPPTEPFDPWWCAWKIYPVDMTETWHFGFAKNCDYRLGGEPAAGDTVVNYTEQRELRMVYDLLHHPVYGPRIDPDRLFVYGHSMGGSGTLAMALRYPNVFAAAYCSEPMTNYRTAGDGGGIDWTSDISPKWGAKALNLPVQVRGPGNWASHLQKFDGTGVWDWQNHQATFANRRADAFVPLGFAHGTADTAIEWPTQGQPAYVPAEGSRQCWGGMVTPDDHTWLSFQGLPYPLTMGPEWGPFWDHTVRRGETVPGLSGASGDSPIPPTGPGGYNQNLEWSASWNPWDGAPVDTPARWQMSFRTADGSNQTVDITPRRLQQFVVSPGTYTWENRRAGDDGLVAAGNIAPDADGLLTVSGFAVSPGGNRLSINRGGSGCVLTCTATVPASVAVDTAVPFSCTATASGCSGGPAYAWTFGDGASSLSQNPTHAYAVAGAFAWTLTVTAEGQTCTRTGTIAVTGTPVCTLTCTASVPGAGSPGAPVSFASTAAPSNCTGAVTFAWTFGDGATSASQYATHTYAAEGIYTWTLTAAIDGVTCSRTGTITISTGGPVRPFPETTNAIVVFNDQLSTWGMTEAQYEFAATHYAGTQKVTRDEARHLRQYNPNFLVLHYRLGQALGYRMPDETCHPTGDLLNIVEGNEWVQEWPGDATVQESWFWHYNASRVYSCVDGHYVMAIDDPGWRSWWSAQVISQLQENEDDGLFADSFSVPYYFNECYYSPCLPLVDEPAEAQWAAWEHAFTDYMQGQFAGRWKWLPNIGPLVNSRDPSDLSNIDGGMVEGFAEWGQGSYFDALDWVLQLNRILPLARADKILICQNYPTSADISERLFILGSYLLVKGRYTYVNMDIALEPEWFPEYRADLGAPTDPLPTDISGFLDPTWDVYLRHFARGMVLVNPADTPRSVDLGATYDLLVPSGGGFVPEDGSEPGTLGTQAVTSLNLPAHGAAILLNHGATCTLTCDASAAPASGLAPLDVNFTGSATPSDCTGAPAFAWTFGDGGTSSAQSPTHTYAAAGTYTWTLTVTVDGQTCNRTGSVTASAAGGIPGDCDGNGTVSIGEVQKAINMYLGTLPVGCNVDCNGSGTVSIGEVQKVINAFLGLASSC